MTKPAKVAIVGYGVEGQAAYRYFAAQGAEVTIFHKDHPDGLPPDVKVVLDAHATDLHGYEVVVRSPATRPDTLRTDGRVTSVTKEFLAVFGTQRVIGVSGSKGKGTTASWIYQMLKSAGKRVHLGGNIGLPALDLLPDISDGDYVVLELSSFQLWDIDVSPHIAVLLMIEPEHLDVHDSVDEYVSAKANIASHQSPEDILIYLPTNDLTVRAASQASGRKLPYTQSPGAYVENGNIVMEGQKIVDVAELKLIGPHNIENACAAVTAAWQITQDVSAIHDALVSFGGLPHRLQFVAEVHGVRYYDDSISTTPGSTIAALRSFEQPKVIILGGSDKGTDFTELAKEAAQYEIRGVVLIGALQDKIYRAFIAAGFDPQKLHKLGKGTMQEIVKLATDIAQAGDIVLLSPACASFDMFADYKDRAEQFVQVVKLMLAK